jgi:hypothetical protein
MNFRKPAVTAALVSALTVAASQSAFALVNVAGGVDPTTGLTTLGTWVLSITGLAIPIICAFKGAHAVAEGRSLVPALGSAIGGMALAFGGAYVLSHYGVT